MRAQKTEGTTESVRKLVKFRESLSRSNSSAEAFQNMANATASPSTTIEAALPTATVITTAPLAPSVVTLTVQAPKIFNPVNPVPAHITPAAPAANIITPLQIAPPIITLSQAPHTPQKINLTLQERMDAELTIAKRQITPGEPVQAVSKILVDRFGPIFARVVAHFAPDIMNRNSVYMSLAAQFTRDLEVFIKENYAG
jgi:hypothetical protein